MWKFYNLLDFAFWCLHVDFDDVKNQVYGLVEFFLTRFAFACLIASVYGLVV